jgi:hypothetical protein
MGYIKTGKRCGPVSALEKLLVHGVWMTVEEVAAKSGVRKKEVARQLTFHPLADYRPAADGLGIEWTLQTRKTDK